MHLDIKKYIFIFIGWLIRVSYQLDCLQCTSPIHRVSQTWDHSCLDGTLTALPCDKLTNGSEPNYKQCVSALYRAGVLIYRACTSTSNIQHECDPHASLIDFDKTDNFYCSRTCSYGGCNRHSVEEITSNTNKLLQNLELILLYLICFIFLFNFKWNLFS